MKKNLLLLYMGLAPLLGSCVVYMPMQCAAPQITDKKQAEVTASSYLNGRFEIAGTYSPVRHLLVRAACSDLRDNSRDSTYYRGRQYDFSVGTYWQLGADWLVGGLGGFGQARSAAGYSEGGLSLSRGQPVRYDFDVSYRKVFGEAYGLFQASDAVSLGAAYRITQVDFTTLTDQNTPVDLRRMTRGEPMLFMRVRLGNGPLADRPVQLQAAMGSSVTLGPQGDGSQSGAVYNLTQGRGYTTVGVTIFPHCLFRPAQPVGPDR